MEYLESPSGGETAKWIMTKSSSSPRTNSLIDSGASLREVAKDRISIIYTDRGVKGFNIKVQSCGCWAGDAVDFINNKTQTEFNSVSARETGGSVLRVAVS